MLNNKSKWHKVMIVACLFSFVLLMACTRAGDGFEKDLDPSFSELRETASIDKPSLPSPRPMEFDFSVEYDTLEPWQEAYIEFLETLVAAEGLIWKTGSDKDTYDLSSMYCMYDVDKDDIPELFIKHGSCEADYYVKVYTYNNNEVMFIGEFGFWHSLIYSWPDENAALLVQGYMGYQKNQKIEIINNEAVLTDVLYEGSSDVWPPVYRSVTEFVPSAKSVKMYRTSIVYPYFNPGSHSSSMALTLPIYLYSYDGESLPTGNSTDEAKVAIEEVLIEERNLYGVSGDGFEDSAEWLSINEYLKPGVLDKYSKKSMLIHSFIWFDLNGDGQEELILRLFEEDYAAAEYAYPILAILSYQEGIVYSYTLSPYPYDVQLGESGVFYCTGFEESHSSAMNISFYKNQCFEVYLPFNDSVPRIEWEIYSDSSF